MNRKIYDQLLVVKLPVFLQKLNFRGDSPVIGGKHGAFKKTVWTELKTKQDDFVAQYGPEILN
jgi:hypothetical protein